MNNLSFLKNIKFGRPSGSQIILWGIGVILAVTGFYFVRGLVTCWTITPLPGRPPSSCGTVTAGGLDEPVFNSEGTPVPSVEELPPPVEIPESDLPPAWDGASRINILVLGLDYRDWEAGLGAPRSDTMILLTIDPLARTAGMLSIPRDMWVNIPGFGYSRINTAYSSGEGNKLPGGGPDLARKTVEQFIGVQIQYYAQVDFRTFVEFIDLIGGIDVYNDEELRLDPVGGGKDKIKLTCCGLRHMNGEKALAYIRYRKGDEGDVGRSKRQQKAILAIREKVLSPENFPVLLGQARQFYEEFSAGIKTDMPFETAIQLGVLAKDIPLESIEPGVIDYTMVALDSTILGGENASVLKPLPDKIRELRDEIFTSGGPLSPLAAQNDPNALMRADGARVRVLNGSFSPGLEVNTGNYLLTQGMAVTEAGPADRAYDRTTVILYSGKLYTLKYLQAVFGINTNSQILIKPDPTSTVDVQVILGNDWANSNTLP
ncbi:MAG TPA: LCP family protein [Anaerolineales bacterium]|nr:LCP family protein [Anaerolineales bacterium]